jgi:hypothetical protein
MQLRPPSFPCSWIQRDSRVYFGSTFVWTLLTASSNCQPTRAEQHARMTIENVLRRSCTRALRSQAIKPCPLMSTGYVSVQYINFLSNTRRVRPNATCSSKEYWYATLNVQRERCDLRVREWHHQLIYTLAEGLSEFMGVLSGKIC